MPHIREAMAGSLRRGVLEILQRRDIASSAADVKNSFSSWDNCMNAAYCKWPVIAAIIIGGLIVFSVVWCIIRCACCGMSCCCSCFSCLKCCGNCCGCCDAPADRKHKHLDDQYFPPPGAHNPSPFHGYQAPAPMMSGAGGFEPPKYAQFETGPNGMAVAPKNPVNDDALPPMPSWETAQKKKIMLEEEESHELGELDPKTGQQVPLMTGAAGISRTNSPAGSPSVTSPNGVHSPYGAMPGPGSQTGLAAPGAVAFGAGALGAGGLAAGAFGAGAMGRGNGNGRDQFGRQGSNDSRNYNDPYNQAVSPNGGPGYGHGFPPGPQISPYNQPYSQDNAGSYPLDDSHGPYDPNDPYNPDHDLPGAFGVLPAGTYPPNRSQSARPYPGDNHPPNGPDTHGYSNESTTSRPLIPAGTMPPINSYNEDSYGNGNNYPRSRPSPPPNNGSNSGFDFGVGAAALSGPGTRGPNTRSPPPGGAYGDYNGPGRTQSPAPLQGGYRQPSPAQAAFREPSPNYGNTNPGNRGPGGPPGGGYGGRGGRDGREDDFVPQGPQRSYTGMSNSSVGGASGPPPSYRTAPRSPPTHGGAGGGGYQAYGSGW